MKIQPSEIIRLQSVVNIQTSSYINLTSDIKLRPSNINIELRHEIDDVVTTAARRAFRELPAAA